MNWENATPYNTFSGTISNPAAKEELGTRIAAMVEDGQVIGVGSGSTAYVTIQAIAKRVHDANLTIAVVCTSPEVTLACAAVNLPIASLLQTRPDWAFDGADEVDPGHNLIKGRGGAMFMEKVMMHASPKNYILVDRSKLVPKLGTHFAIPVEVLPIALRVVEFELRGIGAVEAALRMAAKKDGPVITENGNFVLDVRFQEIHQTLERDIKAIPGVIESGLFWGREIEILVAED